MSSSENKICIDSDEILVKKIIFDISDIVPGEYSLNICLYEIGMYGANKNIDIVENVLNFNIKSNINYNHGMGWNNNWWGYYNSGDLIVK